METVEGCGGMTPLESFFALFFVLDCDFDSFSYAFGLYFSTYPFSDVHEIYLFALVETESESESASEKGNVYDEILCVWTFFEG